MENEVRSEKPKRSEIVAIRVRPNELETLREFADSEGRTVSNAVRQLLREAMQHRSDGEIRA